MPTMAILNQILAVGRVYAYVSAIAFVLLVVWMAVCCVSDWVPSKYFAPPTREPGDLWPERRRQLAATVSNQVIQ